MNSILQPTPGPISTSSAELHADTRCISGLSIAELRSHVQSCRWLAGHAFSRWKATGCPRALAEHKDWIKARDAAGMALSAELNLLPDEGCFFSSDLAQAMGRPGWTWRALRG